MGQVWSPFGVAEAAIVGGADPKTALDGAPPRRSATGSPQPVAARRAARRGSPAARPTAGDARSRHRAPRPMPRRSAAGDGDIDTAPAELGPDRRQHARAARQDPAARRSSPRSPSRLAIPLVANQEWVWLAVLIVVDARDLRRLPPAVAHPDQVPRPGHDLPDRLPGHPGRRPRSARRSRTSVTATAARRRTRSPAIEASSVQQVAGLGRVRPDDRDRGRRRDRRPRLPARTTRPRRPSSRATRTA